MTLRGLSLYIFKGGYTMDENITKLLIILAREMTINNQLKMVEDAFNGLFNNDIMDFQKFMNDMIVEDVKLIREIDSREE